MKPRINRGRVLAAALTGIALGALPVQAAVVPAPAVNDIFLGVRVLQGDEGSNPGQTTSYLVNLGLYSTFSSATSTFTLDLGNINSDLSRIYGSDWATRDDLYWGVFGIGQDTNPVVYSSLERVAGSSVSIPSVLSSTERGFTRSALASVITSDGIGYAGRQSTFEVHGPGTGSALATEQTGITGAASYITQVGTNPLDFSIWSSIEAPVAGDTVLDLFRFRNNAVDHAGHFTFDGGGLSFTPVPEPSVSLLALVGSLAVVASRRRPAPTKH